MQRRRLAVYFSWNRARESEAPLGGLDNRYPALFELRRAIWPHYEWAADPERYPQGVVGFLDHVVLFDFKPFLKVVAQASGNEVALLQRSGAADGGPLEEGILAEVDTLVVVSLDHLATEQRVTPPEVQAVRSFLARDGTCLLVCPHHDVGASPERSARQIELAHHGDRLVPSQQRIGGFARSLLAGLGFPIENRFGLSPAAAPDGSPAALDLVADADEIGLLAGVTTFNLHPHLPHFEIPASVAGPVRVLARQRINPLAPSHPFRDGGRDTFDAMVWIPPEGARKGHVVVCDATLWSGAFGGASSLAALWKNVATFGG